MHPIDKKKKRGLVQEKMKAGVGMEEAAAARLMVVVAVLGILIGGVSGQGTPNCENDLRPCVPAAANVSVKPDSYCCSVLKKAVVDDLDCLCDLYYKSGTTFFETLQINKTRVLEIITMCGINDPLSLCNHAPGSLPAPSSQDPQTAPPPTAGVDSSNAASRLRWAIEPWLALAWLLLSITHRPLIL